MEIVGDDAIKHRAAEVAEWLHSVIDIPDSLFGKPPHGESTHKIHFGIPDAFAKRIRKEDYSKYYEPRVVSIGPFHHGKPHVAPMEYCKRQAVRELAEREKSKVSIEQVYASVEQELLRIAKECYDVSRWDGISDREWCLMMFLDGCFVIEFISNYHINTSGRKSWFMSIVKKHDRDLVHRDLLLLENQLPFQVLLMLARAFRCEGFDFDAFPIKLLEMPLSMIFSARLASRVSDYHAAVILNHRRQQRNASAPAHLLQFYRDIWGNLLSNDDVKEEKEEEDHLAVCPPFSVTELKKVGIRCSCAMVYPGFLDPTDIYFKSSILSGHLFLPPLTIDEWTVTFFSNILAYEYSCSMLLESSAISSYLNFMCMLINGEEDIKELRARGILNVNFKDDDKLINFLRDITAHTESNYKIRYVKKQISDHCKSKRLPLRIGYAELKQRYFSGPWSFFVFLAVIFTVSMTVIQTIFTGIQTYK